MGFENWRTRRARLVTANDVDVEVDIGLNVEFGCSKITFIKGLPEYFR